MNAVDQIIYLGYKQQIDKIMDICNPGKWIRGKIYTHICAAYTGVWVGMIKTKENLMANIKYNRYHFKSQEPYFNTSHDIPMISH